MALSKRNIASDTMFNIYLLYPMDRDNEANFYRLLQNYINIGTEIYAYLLDWEKMDAYPKFNLYVPADHEIFIHNAYQKGVLSKEQIYNVDCAIIEKCNLLILFGGYNGLKKHEIPSENDIVKRVKCAEQNKIAVYAMPDLGPEAIAALKLAIKLVIKSGG